MLNRIMVFLLLTLIPFMTLYGEENLLDRGEQLFMENRPADAIPLFLGALEKAPDEAGIYLMLGIAYSQTENYEKAVNYFREGAKKALKERDIYFYNAGNAYYLMGEYPLAEEMYSRAIRENGSRSNSSYLNRANTRLSLEKREDAISDYKVYLNIEPDNYQREPIQKLIDLLEKRGREELVKKQQDEALKLAEEKRKQELLRDVLDSLKNISDETRNVSAETEKISDYEEELELKD
ncbi:MAG: tetratricopeptide repeat protein [Spirochaetia bacterium]|nr:tetratricopeptide repeat protein [Spirochaetia bacterium]